MSNATPTSDPTLAQLDDYARHEYHGVHFGLIEGLERRIETLAHANGVRTPALASHLLLLGLEEHAARTAEAPPETEVFVTNADASGSWAKDGVVASFEWTGTGELRQVFSGEVPPRRRSLDESMMILLNDAALCDELRRVTTAENFGTVIRDIAAAMAGER